MSEVSAAGFTIGVRFSTAAGVPNVNPVLFAGVPNDENGDGVSVVFLLSVDLSSAGLATGVPNPVKGEGAVAVDDFPKLPSGEGASAVFVVVVSTVDLGVPNENVAVGLVAVDDSLLLSPKGLLVAAPNPPNEGVVGFSGSAGFTAGAPNENPLNTAFFGSLLVLEGAPKENEGGVLTASLGAPNPLNGVAVVVLFPLSSESISASSVISTILAC